MAKTDYELEQAGYTRFNIGDVIPHGYYLCVGHAGTRYICLMSNGKWYRQSGSKQIVGITHWMQLPEPPSIFSDVDPFELDLLTKV